MCPKDAYRCTREFRKPTGVRWDTRWWALGVRMKASLRSRCNGFLGWCSECYERDMCRQKFRKLKIEKSPWVKEKFNFLEKNCALQLPWSTPWSTLWSPPLLLPPLLCPKAPADDDDERDETFPTAPADNEETDLVRPADRPLSEAPKEWPMELEWKMSNNCFWNLYCRQANLHRAMTRVLWLD